MSEIVTILGTEVKVPKRKPRATSTRKRPNKSFILKNIAFRGFSTGNEKVQLEGLKVKNALARVNNRAMDENVDINFNGKQAEALQKAMKAFVKAVNEVMK